MQRIPTRPHPLWFILLSVFVSWSLLGTSFSVAQSGQAAFDEGYQAFEQASFERALEAFKRVEASDSLFAEAQYWMAKIYLDSTYLDFNKAETALDRAIRRDRQNIKYRELDLLRQHMRPMRFLPTVFATRRQIMAGRLLKLDAENAVAHRVLGSVYFKDYMALHGAQGFHSSQVSDGNMDALIQNAEMSLASSDSSGVVDFRIRGDQSGMPFHTVSLEAQALEVYNKTRHHLLRSMRSDPTVKETYTRLMHAAAVRQDRDIYQPVLRSMAKHFISDSDFWLYRGFAEYKRGALADATVSFETGISMMPPAEQAAYEDIEEFLTKVQNNLYEADSVAYASVFWEERDPRLLTTENERKLEHYARMVYADLRFGKPKKGKRGWRYEPGQVVVRYGEPVRETRMASSQDAYMIFHYGDIEFVFMDLVKAGEYTFFSPGAGQPTFRGPTGWDGDYVIKSRETFREVPERFRYNYNGRRVEIPFLVSSFKGDQDMTDIFVPFGVPFTPVGGVNADGERIKSGAFLLVPSAGIFDEDRADTPALATNDMMSFSSGMMWSGLHHLQAPYGNYTLAVEFDMREPSPVAGFQRMPLEVPNYQASGLQLSDVLLAYSIEESTAADAIGKRILVRDGLEIQPAPWGVFALDQPIYLYLEVYGLTTNATGQTAYDVEAVIVENQRERPWQKLIKRAFRRSNDGVSIRFPGQGTSIDESQSFLMDPQTLEPGTYALLVRITDKQTGETVERGRTLILE